ncbi:MAG: hypothetical protein LBV12_07135 [Puniceicoccales bacterium]|jgi:hypothetical protein|nr:hypothetical protein [Puniceicoccales bacterium]
MKSTKKKKENRGVKKGQRRGYYNTDKVPMAVLSVMVPEEMRDGLRARADKKGLTLNAYCRELFTKAIK